MRLFTSQRRCFFCRSSLCLLLFTLLVYTPLSACVLRFDWPEHTVNVSLDVAASKRAANVRNLFVAIDAIELRLCKDSGKRRGYGGIASLQLKKLLLPEAYAHGISTPTRIATHHIVSLIHGAKSEVIGQWQPDPGKYCGVDLLIATSDPNAIGLAQNPEMLNHSVGILYDMEEARYTTRSIEKRVIFPQPIEFPNDGGSLKLNFTVKISLAKPIPKPNNTGETLDSAWLQNLQQDLQVEVFR